MLYIRWSKNHHEMTKLGALPYPISNFKINEILKNDKNHIGTYSKNNAPKLKNNESTIVNLANSYDKGTHWIAMKFIDKNCFILIRMEYYLFQIL